MDLGFLMQLYAILGFVAHLAREPVTGHMRRGWQDLTHYAIGVIGVFPLSLFMFRYLERDIKAPITRHAISYIISFISVGTGVYIGHWYKPVKG